MYSSLIWKDGNNVSRFAKFFWEKDWNARFAQISRKRAFARLISSWEIAIFLERKSYRRWGAIRRYSRPRSGSGTQAQPCVSLKPLMDYLPV